VNPQLKKFIGFVLFVGTTIASHNHSLPQLLVPYAPYIEILGWVGSLYNAYLMTPMGQDETK
jgi:hypothetical protein